MELQSGEDLDPQTTLDKIVCNDERRLYSLAEIGLPEIIGIGSLKYQKNHTPLPPHCHPHAVEIHLCQTGASRFEIEGADHVFLPNTICLTQPGVRHRLATVEKRQEHYWMMFSTKAWATSFLGLRQDESQTLLNRLRAIDRTFFPAEREVEVLFREVVNILERASFGPEHTLRLRIALLRLIIKIIDSAERKDDAESSEILNAVIFGLREHPEQHTTVTELARQAQMSESHFIHAFKKTTGLTPNAFRTEARINVAKRLLKDPSLRLVDIAIATGFASHAHFSTVFSHEVGITPLSWRKNAVNKQ